MQQSKIPTEKIPVIAVVGPTASGKTDLAVALGRRFDGEVVSADSMQVYQGFTIASAKPSAEEMGGVAHHMLDFLPLTQSFSVAQYTEMAKDSIFDIHRRGKTAIVAGGTGLYVDSLLQNLDFGTEPDLSAPAEALRERLEKEGPEALHRELMAVDPDTARELHPNNTGRVLRALTVFYATGERMSERKRNSRSKESPFAVTYIGVDFRQRQRLYDRIDRRVDDMLTRGLLEEARETAAAHGKTSAQAIGHKELLPFLQGECSLQEAVESLKRATRRYAKRQLTWFRRNEAVHWFYRDDFDDGAAFLEAVCAFLAGEGFADAQKTKECD